MRVSSASMYLTMKEGLGSSLGRVQEVQGQLASGRRINRASDDPVGATASQRYRAQEADWESWQRSANDAQAWLGTADGVLQSSSSLLRRVRELTTSAVSGALSTESREAIASEVEQLRDELKSMANAQHMGRSVFGGFSPRAVEQVNGAWAFTGDDGQVRRQVGPTQTVQVNLDGRNVFGFAPGQTDVFSLLDKIAVDVRSGSSAGLEADQVALATRTDAVLTALGLVGATANRVTAASNQGFTESESLRMSRSSLEDIDIAEAVLNLNTAQVSYQAALGAVAKANLPSLANFLR